MYQATIGHAMLYVRDLERAIAFYTSCLILLC
jgi:catechol 2,3-dioxygenase-like lactoylglutathione lyase family enzyme